VIQKRRFTVVRLVLLLLLIALVLPIGLANTTAALPQATKAATPANGLTAVKCQPMAVSASARRVSVKCATGVGKVVFFAASTEDENAANRYLTLLTDALTAKKQVVIDVLMSDTSGETFGCMNADCRAIQAITIEQ
jgi:hypothetical protein